MFGIDDIVGKGLSILDKFIPDTNARAAAKEEMESSLRDGVQKLLEGQIEINKIQQSSSSMFVAGPRPAAMWVCVMALFCYYVPYMLTVTALWTWMTFKLILLACTSDQACLDVHIPPRPDLGVTDLIGLLLSLLGLGTMRTVEKLQGVDTGVATPSGVLGFVKSVFK